VVGDPATPAPASSGDRWPLAATIALALLAFAALMFIGRGIGFFYDEWNFVLFRRAWTADTFLQPHNEHIAVLPVLVYKTLFELVGLSSHWPYRMLPAALHAGIGVTVFLLARSRVGGPAALLAAALVLVMGRTSENLLWAFQIGFLGSVLGGLLALLALDRGRRAAACAALVFATLCSSLGVPFALGVAVEQLAGGRRRALWVPAVPLALYAVWWVGYGRGTNHITADSAAQATTWASDAAAAAAGSVVGLSIDWGRVLLVLLVAALLVRVVRQGTGTPRLAALIVTVVTFWALTGAARSLLVDPSASRYLTLGGVVMVLVVVELLAGTAITRRALAAGALLVVFAGLASLPSLRGYARNQRHLTGITAAELGALQLAGASAPAAFQPDPGLAPQVTAGPYLAAVRDQGSSPADTAAELPRAYNEERGRADEVLQQVALAVTRATARSAGCTTVRSGATRELPLPPGGVTLVGPRAGATLRVRRFGDGFVNPPLALPAKAAAVRIAPRSDASPVAYRAQVVAGPRSLLVCTG